MVPHRDQILAIAIAIALVACKKDGESGASTSPVTSSDDNGVSTSPVTTSAESGPPEACGNAAGQLLRPEMAWNTSVAGAAVATDSPAVIDYLSANVGDGARFQIDFSIAVLTADLSTTRHSFTPTGDFFETDCDPAPIPVPDGGHLEGEAGYTCDGDGDCHLIVVDRANCRLYEQWRANFAGPSDFSGGCLAIWELERAYDETLRGDFCTSADAAGLPIAPLLFTADEIVAGSIEHAIRFIVPNADIRADRYVRPGTHSTGATSGPAGAPPYSGRLRLKADVDTSSLNPAAQIVATTLKTYGMILADAGSITFTAADDDFTTAKWDSVGLGPLDLKDLQWSDFELIDAGPTIAWSSGSCERAPITD